MRTRIEFPPYAAFRASVAHIEEFAALTDLSYGLALQLLFKHPKANIPKVQRKTPPLKELSFSMADQDITSVDLVCGWLPAHEYASRTNSDPAIISDRALRGELGPIERHPDTTEMLLIWPPEFQTKPRAELPDVGKNQYRVTLTEKARVGLEIDVADLSSFEATQAEFLRLAHALGDPASVAERAGEVLNRATLLLYWTAFEVCLRSTIQEMIRRHPRILASGRRARETVTYEDLAALSADFTSAERLRENLVMRELEKHESIGESVHGLINYLKAQFRFETDPYKAWYVYKGQRHQTSFSELKQLKDTRNTLMHNAGRPSERFMTEYPEVPIRDGAIAVDDAFLLRNTLLLNSIAFNIARTIVDKKYKVDS